MPRVLKRIGIAGALLLASLFAISAQASYGQMKLDGAGLLLALVLSLLYCGLIDLLLSVKLFRYRPPLAIATLIAGALAIFFFAMVLSPGERTGYFKGEPGGLALGTLVATAALFVPFMVAAPAAQYRSLKAAGEQAAGKRRWPAWVGIGMALQGAAVLAFVVFAFAG